MQAYAGTMTAGVADMVVASPVEETHSVAQAKTVAPGAASSVVYGVLGLFLFGVILGLVAISKASAAKKLIAENPEQYTGGGRATTGMVLGVIDLIGAAVAFVIMMAS